MSYFQRHPYKFESANGALSYTFPVYAYEWDPEQDLNGTIVPVQGADYGHDGGGMRPWSKGLGAGAVRFEVVGSSTPAALDATVSAAVAAMYRAGLGKLYGIDSAGTIRWCWARLRAMPLPKVTIQEWMRQPLSLNFLIESDWLASSLTTGSATITTSPQTVTINNPGDLDVKGAAALVFRARANGAAGFSAGFTLANSTAGLSLTTARASASANSEVRIDCEREAVEYSNDNGGSYSDDYANLTIPSTQVPIMELQPGDNTFVVTTPGTPNFDLEWQFYAPYPI